MSKFIELTRHITDDKFLVNTNNILSVFPDEGCGSLVYLAGDDPAACYRVKESYGYIKCIADDAESTPVVFVPEPNSDVEIPELDYSVAIPLPSAIVLTSVIVIIAGAMYLIGGTYG